MDLNGTTTETSAITQSQHRASPTTETMFRIKEHALMRVCVQEQAHMAPTRKPEAPRRERSLYDEIFAFVPSCAKDPSDATDASMRADNV